VAHPCEIEWAIKTFDPTRYQNQNGIFPVLLRMELYVLLGSLTRVLRASIALRHFPQAWSRTK